MSDTLKYDDEKNRLDLIPVSLIEEVGLVLTHGAKKYKDRGWEVGMEWHRPYGAALRHIAAFWRGEDIDGGEKGSQRPHLACAITELAFLLEYMKTHPELDNRPGKKQSQVAAFSPPVHDLYPTKL